MSNPDQPDNALYEHKGCTVPFAIWTDLNDSVPNDFQVSFTDSQGHKYPLAKVEIGKMTYFTAAGMYCDGVKVGESELVKDILGFLPPDDLKG